MASKPLVAEQLQLSQGNSYYEIFGTEGEWVVCLHGITFWSFCYHTVAPAIAEKGYRVLLFDFYGRGNSDAPAMDYNLDLFVSQTKELLEKLNITRANMMGFSMGGCVAGTFALRYPKIVNKLIFIAPAVVPIEVPFAARLMTVPYIGRGLFNMLGKNAMLKKLRTERLSDDFAFPARVPEVIDEAVKKVEWLIEEKTGFLHAFHSTLYHVPLGIGILNELANLSQDIKVYVLWGDQDKIIPHIRSQDLLNVIPLAKFETINECGHSCLLEKPQEAREHLISFLADNQLQRL